MANKPLHKYTVQEALGIKAGAGGVDYAEATAPEDESSPTVVTTNAHKYVKIIALTACVVTAVSTDTDIWDNLTLLSIPSGTVLYGNWSSVVLTNGVESSATTKILIHREYSTD